MQDTYDIVQTESIAGYEKNDHPENLWCGLWRGRMSEIYTPFLSASEGNSGTPLNSFRRGIGSGPADVVFSRASVVNYKQVGNYREYFI
jgi:hypothetical protein